MTSRILLVREFDRFARKNRVSRGALVELVRRADLGIVDADLGGGIVKLRLARANEGKSSGYRTIVAYRAQGHVFFLYGFAKNDQANVTPHQLTSLREIGRQLMARNEPEIDFGIEEGELIPIEEDE